MRGDDFIKLGFWSQLVLLALIDWGTLVAWKAEPNVAWYHYVGFTVVNLFLIWATWVMWTWLKPQRSKDPNASSHRT